MMAYFMPFGSVPYFTAGSGVTSVRGTPQPLTFAALAVAAGAAAGAAKAGAAEVARENATAMALAREKRR
jgi:hypothetical protein